MADMKNIGIAIVVLGLLGALLAASADYSGLNLTQENKNDAEFGWVQIAGVIAGASILVIGVIITLKSAKKPEEGSEDATEDEAAKEEVVCPTCGASVANDATNCEECGEKFETETPEDEAGESETEESSTDESGTEETANEESSEEPESGEPATGEPENEGGETEEYECPTCNATLGVDDKKCPKCGEEFE